MQEANINYKSQKFLYQDRFRAIMSIKYLFHMVFPTDLSLREICNFCFKIIQIYNKTTGKLNKKSIQ